MIAVNFKLSNYRNIEKAEITLAPGTTVLYGNNGQGKTNLLEGLSMFALGRSFRGAKDRELLRYSSDGASLELTVDDGGDTKKLSIRYSADGRRVCRKNGVCVRSLAEFVGNFRVVLFASPQLSTVRDSGAARRRFLDAAISQLRPVYLERLTKMNRLLLQRNKLLKQLAENPSNGALRATIEPWTLQFAAESAFVSQARFRYAERLMPLAAAVVRDMSLGREKLTLACPEPKSHEQLFCELMAKVDREIMAGVTLYGAHREDMDICINERDARIFASQGQQRSAALALKLAEGMLSETVCGSAPMYLLDDVLSELDESRRRYVLSNIEGHQVLLTVCDNNITGDKIYKVDSGIFTESDEYGIIEELL